MSFLYILGILVVIVIIAMVVHYFYACKAPMKPCGPMGRCFKPASQVCVKHRIHRKDQACGGVYCNDEQVCNATNKCQECKADEIACGNVCTSSKTYKCVDGVSLPK